MDLSDVELRHLRYFVAVAEELHFGRAALRLGIAQPPLSQQIQRLEQAIGTVLFQRRPRVSLTPAGATLLDAARRALGMVGDTLAAAQRVGRGEAGLLRLSAAASTLLGPLPMILRSFRRRFPLVAVRLLEMPSAEQVEALASGGVDAGILREPDPNDDLVFHRIAVEPFVAVLPPEHRLSKKGKVRLKELDGEPFVHFPRRVAPALFDRVADFCAAAGFTPTVTQEAQEWFTIVGLVESGLGVSIVPSSFSRLRWGRIVYRPIYPAPPGTETYVGVRGRAAPPIADRFVRLAVEMSGVLDEKGLGRRGQR